MKYLILFFFLTILIFIACKQQQKTVYHSFEEYPEYSGTDLGLTYSSQKSSFKIWSPAAEEVRIFLYEEGTGGEPMMTKNLKRGKNGEWSEFISGDLHGKYYAFQVKFEGEWLREAPDPYARAVGVNGKRAMVVDIKKTNPESWDQDKSPELKSFSDIVLYELHIRDVSVHPNSGISHKGKFLGLAETGTKSSSGEVTGLDHIKELGVTHVHLLPSYDYLSIDESKLEENNFNWGYDPQNYNVPEGSYSTDPYNGAVRIREFKQLVKTLHENGLRVILDVVYNHTGDTEFSNFNQIAPGYYYRQNEEGGFSDASACGNETASERPMVRKFMIESVKHWVEEYHLDGFRFDLMGIHDIETMNQIAETLHAIDPTIFIYGEGWTAGSSPLSEEQQALKKNTIKLRGVAAFSDDIRDGIKGHVFTPGARAFASAEPGLEESVKFGIVASTQHAQVDYSAVNYSKAPWANEPTQTINYVSCHDNHTLYDRLKNSNPDATEAELIKMHKLSNAIVFTSQGVPFLHAGVEMLRTKNGEENSFESPDSINRIDWSRKTTYKDVFEYYQGLIKLRKNHPAFRMPTTEMIQQHLKFLDMPESNLIGYIISGNANGDSWGNILVLFNGNKTAIAVSIPAENWTMVLNGEKYDDSGVKTIRGGEVTIPASTALVMRN